MSPGEFVRLYCGCRTTASGLPVARCHGHDPGNEIVDCDHQWIANSGKGGEPVYKLNSQMGRKPIMHARCSRCGDRTWFTADQWEILGT